MTDALFADIIPAQALGISVSAYRSGRIELTAPLAANLNDKGTGFAGSIASILLLTGWGVITLRLREAGIPAIVVAVKNETAYAHPVRADFTTEAAITDAEMDRLKDAFKTRQRGRMCVRSKLICAGVECAAMTAHYAILPPA